MNSDNGKTSVLILGKGGLGHTAPDLTDTMMLATVNVNKNNISLLSLPRDIWVESTRAKLNSSYYWGKQKGGNGFDLASMTVKEITGVTPQYSIVVDFSLFKDVINTIGGIDINVENSFVDQKYPIEGKENDLCGGDRTYKCRYEILDIKSGPQHMNGDLALKFVRSRNAEGDEGTDIAREKRQQKVVSAVKDKILSKDVLLNFKTIRSLYDIMMSHIETNIDKESLVALGRELLKSKDNITFLNIPENILKVSQNDKKYDRQYVFIPVSGSWKELQEWIKSSM